MMTLKGLEGMRRVALQDLCHLVQTCMRLSWKNISLQIPEGEEVRLNFDVNGVWKNVLMLLQDGKEGGGEERMAGENTGVSVAEEEG